MLKTNPVCRICGAELNDENWYISQKKRNGHICKSCNSKQRQQWRKANPEKARAQSERQHRKRGQRPFNKNKECAQYLGCYIAEGVLSQAFKDVQRMPMNNPGYDIICNHNKLIDVKSSCVRKDGRWLFHINHNQIADYFLCLAFDNRKDLNPLHAWLILGSKLNHLISATIRPSTIHRWDAYKLDVTKVAMCCDAIR